MECPRRFSVVGLERPVEVPRDIGVVLQGGKDGFEVCLRGPIRIVPAEFSYDINLAVAGDPAQHLSGRSLA